MVRHCGVMLLLLPVLLACTATTAPSTPPAVTGSTVPESTRFALQVIGYIGGHARSPVNLQLVFADRGETAAPTVSGFQDFVWLTDRGPFTAVVESVTPSEAGPSHRLTSLATRVDGFDPGRYLMTGIRYTDASGAVRSLRIGRILIDVRQGSEPPPFEFPSHSVGQTRLEFIELSIMNTSSEAVTIRGLDFALPEVAVETHMERPAAGRIGGSGAPAVQAPSERVDAVPVLPGRETAIRFVITPSDPSAVRFSVLAPFLRYDIAGADEGITPVPIQVYFPPFNGAADLDAYLNALPPDARHSL